jgi:hypothetical protein
MKKKKKNVDEMNEVCARKENTEKDKEIEIDKLN